MHEHANISYLCQRLAMGHGYNLQGNVKAEGWGCVGSKVKQMWWLNPANTSK